jgi:hypothetical protein
MNIKKKIIVTKKIKIKFFFSNFHRSNDVSLTFSMMSEEKKSQIEIFFKISDLIQNEFNETIIKTIIKFKNKIDMLFIQFFLNTSQTNLNDTLKYRYLNIVIKTHKNIIKKNIFSNDQEMQV